MERPFYVVNGCGYGATEKNRFFPSYDDFFKSRHFEPDIEFIFNVSAIKCCFLDLTILNFIGNNDFSL